MSSETMNIILTSVIVPVIVALVPFLIAYMNKKTDEVKAKINDARISKYINIAEDAVETAVVSVTQTFVDSIKGGEEWTAETQKQAFEEAKLKAILIMGTAAREALKEAYGDMDSWISNKIEYYVNLRKAV